MVKQGSAVGFSPAMRFFWRCVAVFMLFGQVAAAAEACRDTGACGSSDRHSSSIALDRHHQDLAELCADEVIPANPMPTIDPAIAIPDLGIAVVELWPPAPAGLVALAHRDAEPLALVPRFLTFRRLLR